MVRELLSWSLRRHLAADGIDSASETREEMRSVGIGGVDDVFGVDGAARGGDCVLEFAATTAIVSGNRSNRGVGFEEELVGILAREPIQEGRDKFIRPYRACRTGDDAFGCGDEEFLDGSIY